MAKCVRCARAVEFWAANLLGDTVCSECTLIEEQKQAGIAENEARAEHEAAQASAAAAPPPRKTCFNSPGLAGGLAFVVIGLGLLVSFSSLGYLSGYKGPLSGMVDSFVGFENVPTRDVYSNGRKIGWSKGYTETEAGLLMSIPLFLLGGFLFVVRSFSLSTADNAPAKEMASSAPVTGTTKPEPTPTTVEKPDNPA